MHATYYRPGGVYRDLPDEMPKYKANKFISEKKVKKLNYNREGSLLDFIEDFTSRFPSLVDEYETLLTDNRIWKQPMVAPRHWHYFHPHWLHPRRWRLFSMHTRLVQKHIHRRSLPSMPTRLPHQSTFRHLLPHLPTRILHQHRRKTHVHRLPCWSLQRPNQINSCQLLQIVCSRQLSKCNRQFIVQTLPTWEKNDHHRNCRRSQFFG